MARKAKTTKRARVGNGAVQARMLDMLHQVWLAGLGAAFKAQHGAPKLFEELVAEGAKLHEDTRDAAEKALRGAFGDVQAALTAQVSKVRGEANDAFVNLEKVFRTRVHRALTQLGVPSSDEVGALSKRVDALNANIDKLARARSTVHKPRARAAAH
jgi:poly(hydroxyalkanoate) granule-associated protein